MPASGQSRRMRPSNIRYTQDSIGSRFTDGSFLSDTFDQLLNRRISVDELEWIEVVRESSLYWALTGNRRLYLFRKLEDLGEVHTIPVRELSLSDYGVRRRFDHRNTTSCDGLDIELRQAETEGHIRSVIESWKASKTINRNTNGNIQLLTSRHLPTEVSSNSAPSVNRNDIALDIPFSKEDDNTASHCGKKSFACAAVTVGLLILLIWLLA